MSLLHPLFYHCSRSARRIKSLNFGLGCGRLSFCCRVRVESTARVEPCIRVVANTLSVGILVCDLEMPSARHLQNTQQAISHLTKCGMDEKMQDLEILAFDIFEDAGNVGFFYGQLAERRPQFGFVVVPERAAFRHTMPESLGAQRFLIMPGYSPW